MISTSYHVTLLRINVAGSILHRVAFVGSLNFHVNFPLKFELYETGSQIRRSAKAVTALIVEGFARRRYKADFMVAVAG